MNDFTSTTSNVELWSKHFRLMAQGKIKPNKHQVFLVDKTALQSTPGGNQKGMEVKMVTPAAQAIEIASSDIKNAGAAPTDADPISHFPSEQHQQQHTQPTSRARTVKRKSQTKVDSTSQSKKKKTTKKPKQWQQYI